MEERIKNIYILLLLSLSFGTVHTVDNRPYETGADFTMLQTPFVVAQQNGLEVQITTKSNK